jgi:hypothetical protein
MINSAYYPVNHLGRVSPPTTRPLIIVALAVFLVGISILFPAIVSAQIEGPNEAPEIGLPLSAAVVYQFPANVDGGGSLSVFSVSANAAVIREVNRQLSFGFGLSYEFSDYHFSGLNDFFVTRPWNQVQRLGAGVPILYSFAEKWRLIVVPSGQIAGEFGADWGNAIVYGGVVAVTYAIRPKSFVGIGMGAYANLEKTSVFPFIAVNWQITDRLRLTNPFRAGPAGPAGLELSYAFTKHWEVGFGGAYRSYRFRLDNKGLIPNGIGEYEFIPIFLRLSYKLSKPWVIELYGGLTFLNKIRVHDSDGDELYRTNHNVAPLVGGTISGNF